MKTKPILAETYEIKRATNTLNNKTYYWLFDSEEDMADALLYFQETVDELRGGLIDLYMETTDAKHQKKIIKLLKKTLPKVYKND